VQLEYFVFSDESGIHGQDARHCLVTGYIGTPKQWELLNAAWHKTLDKYQVSRFHAWEFFARDKRGLRVGPYKGWSDVTGQRFLLRLCGIINKRGLKVLGAGVDTQAFNRLTRGERQHLTGGFYYIPHGKFLRSGAPTKPYYLALQQLVLEAFQQSADGSIIHFILDRQKLLGARARELIKDMELVASNVSQSVLGDRKVGLIGHRSSAGFPPLQAADLHVNSWYGFYQRGADNMSNDRILAMNELALKRPAIKTFHESAIEAELAKIPAEIRERLKRL